MHLSFRPLAAASFAAFVSLAATYAAAQQLDTSPSYPSYEPKQTLPQLDLPQRSGIGTVNPPSRTEVIPPAEPVTRQDTYKGGKRPQTARSGVLPATDERTFKEPAQPSSASPPDAKLPAPATREAIARGTVVTGKAKVLDGQNLVVNGLPLRLDGAEAPGAAQVCMTRTGTPWECGRRARARLATLADGRKVTCVTTQPIGQGAAAICGGNGVRDLAERLVWEGLAVANGHDRGRYAEMQSSARASGRGVWIGSFVLPWKWRAANER